MPTIQMPPPPPPPAMRDAPEVDAAEFEMNAAPKSATKNRKKYRKKSTGSSKSVGNKKYKGGGLNA
jgi:hypothetical protein